MAYTSIITNTQRNIFINMIRLRDILEQRESGESVRDEIIRRVPFLREFNITRHPRDARRLEAQRVAVNKEVTTTMGQDIITFPQFNVSSNITYYPHQVDAYTFHNFIVKNEFHVMQPADMDALTWRVLVVAIRGLQDTMSYSKELMVPTGHDIPKQDMDSIIAAMNKTLFQIESYTNTHNISLFS